MRIGFKGDTIGVLLVQNTGQFHKTAFDVWEWQYGPVAKLFRIAFLEIGGEIVAFFGCFTGQVVVGIDEVGAGGGDADDGLGDVEG